LDRLDNGIVNDDGLDIASKYLSLKRLHIKAVAVVNHSDLVVVVVESKRSKVVRVQLNKTKVGIPRDEA